jgi:energy-coupling factor transporter ATP-binding protein EcfA2
VVAVSSAAAIGVDRLLSYLEPRRTSVILGSSGAGKSTLMNTLLGENRLVTRAVRQDGKGRHTTTHRELFLLPNGALVIDTPGLREVGLWDAAHGVRSAFDDIEALANECRFRDCRHEEEPGCAVQAAVRDGVLDPDRLGGWRRLAREVEYLERRQGHTAAAEGRRATELHSGHTAATSNGSEDGNTLQEEWNVATAAGHSGGRSQGDGRVGGSWRSGHPRFTPSSSAACPSRSAGHPQPCARAALRALGQHRRERDSLAVSQHHDLHAVAGCVVLERVRVRVEIGRGLAAKRDEDVPFA